MKLKNKLFILIAALALIVPMGMPGVASAQTKSIKRLPNTVYKPWPKNMDKHTKLMPYFYSKKINVVFVGGNSMQRKGAKVAVKAWNKSAGMKMKIVSQKKATTRANTIIIYWDSVLTYDKAGADALGMTVSNIENGHTKYRIDKHGRKKVKQAYQKIATVGLLNKKGLKKFGIKPTKGFYEVVTAHELGHALGLDHSKKKKDIMYWTFGTAEPSIGKADVKVLHKLYK